MQNLTLVSKDQSREDDKGMNQSAIDARLPSSLATIFEGLAFSDDIIDIRLNKIISKRFLNSREQAYENRDETIQPMELFEMTKLRKVRYKPTNTQQEDISIQLQPQDAKRRKPLERKEKR